MSNYKVGTHIDFKKRERNALIQCLILALITGIVYGIAITN